MLAGQSLRIAFEHDAAVRQEQHPVADRFDLDHVVARPQDAAMAAFDQARDAGADVARGGRVDRGGRLVEQQQPRLVEHRLGEGQARLLARGQHARLGAPVLRQIVGLRAGPRSAPRPCRCRRSWRTRAGSARRSDCPAAAHRRRRNWSWRAPRCGRSGGRRPRWRSRPAVGSRTPRIMLIVVVLPAPFGPRRPTISPGETEKETPSTARSLPNDLARRSTERTLGGGGFIGRPYPIGRPRRQAAPKGRRCGR